VDEQRLTEEGQARRRFLKQAGTVAWASPFIVTMMSRAAHAQDVQCGEVGLDPNVCVVATPCGSTEQCVPSPNPLDQGACFCAALPNP
jgi:hypothetical protein